MISTTWYKKSLKTEDAARDGREFGGSPIHTYMRINPGESTGILVLKWNGREAVKDGQRINLPTPDEKYLFTSKEKDTH